MTPMEFDLAHRSAVPWDRESVTLVKTFTLTFKWDDSDMWMLTSEGIDGLILIAPSFSEMLEELGAVVPELMELNGQTFPEKAR